MIFDCKQLCPICNDDISQVHMLANCENVCDKCCKHEPYCQDCEYFDKELVVEETELFEEELVVEEGKNLEELIRPLFDELRKVREEDSKTLSMMLTKEHSDIMTKDIVQAIRQAGYVKADEVQLRWIDKVNISLQAMIDLYAPQMGYKKEEKK